MVAEGPLDKGGPDARVGVVNGGAGGGHDCTGRVVELDSGRAMIFVG